MEYFDRLRVVYRFGREDRELNLNIIACEFGAIALMRSSEEDLARGLLQRANEFRGKKIELEELGILEQVVFELGYMSTI